jgi:hypothetical protein
MDDSTPSGTLPGCFCDGQVPDASKAAPDKERATHLELAMKYID